MTSAKVWNGNTDVDGGLLVVRRDWEVVCFHIFNFGQLQNYLYDNVKFDTPNSRKNNIFRIVYRRWQTFLYAKFPIQVVLSPNFENGCLTLTQAHFHFFHNFLCI